MDNQAVSAPPSGRPDHNVVVDGQFLGTEGRWRRFGEPTPAGRSLREDGTPDFGLFGPGSVVWEVALHPATMFFQNAAQPKLQHTYRPIDAGARDCDPLSRDARKGTVTYFDAFERSQRNNGIHAPIWFGDTATAERTWKHLHNVHTRVIGDVIDIGEPELGGYYANSPREAMWAALTEMHVMLWMYEAFAFRDGEPPHRLEPEKRDQYWSEIGSYCRLVGADEDDIPTSTADLKALYEKYKQFFKRSETMPIIPATGQNWQTLMLQVMQDNYHPSQQEALDFLSLQGEFGDAIVGAMSAPARRNMGIPVEKDAFYEKAKIEILPRALAYQDSEHEMRFQRVLWGPDAVGLIASARELHGATKIDSH